MPLFAPDIDFKEVVIQKPDLDTCLAGLVMGADAIPAVRVLSAEAPEALLSDPLMLCIEAGGGGQVHLNNFDHHDDAAGLPPACVQALSRRGLDRPDLAALVRYAALVDEAKPLPRPIAFPSLSSIFSGMLLTTGDPAERFVNGMGLLTRVLSENIDPWSTMPDLPEWRRFIAAKTANAAAVEKEFEQVRRLISQNGLRIGYVQSRAIGGIGRLYRDGCDVAVLFNPAFGNPPAPKFTIAGNDVAVIGLKPCFDRLEPGWGGQTTIIGSPRRGTALSAQQVLSVVVRGL